MNWHDDVPAVEKCNSLTLVRTPPKGKLGGIVTSEAIVGCFTHYWGGRTIPCEGDACEACLQGVGNRWHGYVAAFNTKVAKHFIFEFTAQAAEGFQRYIALAGKLRGCGFYAERRGYRPNSPVLIQCQPANLDGIALPDSPDLKKILAMIWGLPTKSIKKGQGYAYSECVHIDSAITDAVRGPTKSVNARQSATA